MAAWAGADTLQLVLLSTRTEVAGQLEEVAARREVPGLVSVHYVADDDDVSFCGLYDTRHLIRLDRPWERWQPRYRCRRCDALLPD